MELGGSMLTLGNLSFVKEAAFGYPYGIELHKLYLAKWLFEFGNDFTYSL